MARKKINLALQGGGAHGAFTWGALDRILQEPEIEIAGISGTSAGALNGAAVKAGMVRGGAQGARDTLDWLWSEVAGASTASASPWFSGTWMSPAAISRGIEMSWPFTAADSVSRVMSPYGWGPFYNNPLKPIVDKLDFDMVCSTKGPAFFVGATNVRTGKIRIFEGDDISTDAILASACLPTLFRAVEIGDDAYWDGGYTGNPALFPLFANSLPNDIVIININPLERVEVPRSAQEIQNRINEISFNTSLFRELRAISFVQRLLEDGALKPGTMKNVLIHMIADDELMNDLSVATKLVPVPSVLDALKQAGGRAADQFLNTHLGDIGERSSVDLPRMFG
ncbi:MAG: patatin-like phospholipase family protein [Pseudomonadota bacterium]